GTIPFDGDSARAVIDKVVAGQAVPPDVVEPDCPPELGAIAVRAMAKDPEGRYPDARAMAKDLNAYLSGGLVGAHRYGSWALIRRFLRRRRRLVLGIASTLLLATVAWWYRGVAEDRREQALAEATRRTARAEVDEVFSQIARGSLRERWLEVHAFEILAKRNAATEDEVEAAVIAALAHPSVDVRRLAARTLSAMRPSVVPALVARLESGVEPSREVRIEIINALGVLRDPESDEAVRRARASEGQQSYLWTQTELAYRMIPLPAVSAGQKLSSEQWFERGTALWWKGRYAEAGAALSEAIAADPANVEAYLRRAQVRRFFNDVDGAMGDYDAVLERYPNHVSALTHRAELKQSVEDYIGALRDIDRVVRQGSLGVEALRTRALIQRFLGRYSSAQADLRRAVELEPQDAKTYTQIASVWMWAGEWRNAQRALDQALRANPSYDYARLLRAQNYLVIEERGAALADIDHVLASDPASNLARRLRAIIQLAERDERGARRDLNYCLENQCIDQESRRPLRFAQRGVVLHAGRGDYAAAMRDLKRALDGNPREVDGFIYRLAALAVARRAGDDDAVAGWLVELRRLEGPLWYHRVAAVLRGDVRLEAIQSMFHHPAQRCALFLAGGLLSETFDLAEGARILYARASEVGAPQELTCILADQASQAVGRPPSPMVLDPRPVAPLR
ncbi:MAG: tetratricopeptide repeat protein, partial [Myxococcota bacterium]